MTPLKYLPLLLVAALPVQAATISQWNFNSTSSDASLTTGTTTPSVGSGTASLLGTVTGAFGSGSANGGSSDPAASTDDTGWQTTTYAGATTGDLTAGVQFLVNTTGYQNITINYDLRHSNTSSRYEAVQYTLNGNDWTTAGFFTGAAGDTWFNVRSIDLSSIAGADNNANFGIRIVAAFESTATGSGTAGYVASNTGSSYAATGTWRFDMATVSGTAIVPEPSAAALGGLGILGLLRRRRASLK